MSLQSLAHWLKVIENQPAWSQYQQYRRVCDLWYQMIPPAVASHTRPLSVHRSILWVATSSAGWAQQLSLQRHTLLKQLNTDLTTEPLVNIRFSSAKWVQSPVYAQDLLNDTSVDFSCFMQKQSPASQPKADNSIDAFQRWAKGVQDRRQTLPICPQCHCRTPQGELKRWSKCAVCMTQDWQS